MIIFLMSLFCAVVLLLTLTLSSSYSFVELFSTMKFSNKKSYQFNLSW